MDELKNIAPNLTKAGKKKPFNVPEGYFENFSVRLSDKIHQEKEPKWIKKYFLELKPVTVLSSVVIILGVAIGIVLFTGNPEEFGSVEVAEMVEENIYYFSEDDIMEVMYDNDNLSVEDEGFSNEAIINFLMDENISLNEIIDAL